MKEHIVDLSKMKTRLDGCDVVYYLSVPGGEICMNDLLGQNITMRFLGEIHCTACGALTRKSFAQGFCYQCYMTAPEAEECVLNPEKCRAHLGVARDMAYSQSHCLIPHYVYLSYTSGIKVGVTRHTQIPTRWIDQGAVQALIVAETPNRHIAGLIEVFLKQYYSDKTQWTKMLMNRDGEWIDLPSEKAKAASLLPFAMQRLVTHHADVAIIRYPVFNYPEKPINVDFLKMPEVTGVFQGIKGQYLFIGDSVVNMRRHAGFKVDFTF